MEIIKKELIALWNALESIYTEDMNKRFSYCVIRNKKMIKDEIESLQEAQQPSQEYIDYNNKRIELCNTLGEKDESGNNIINKGQYVFADENKEKLDTSMKEIVAQYSDAIEGFAKQEKDFASILEETVSFDLYESELDDVPDMISPEKLEILDYIIK